MSGGRLSRRGLLRLLAWAAVGAPAWLGPGGARGAAAGGASGQSLAGRLARSMPHLAGCVALTRACADATSASTPGDPERLLRQTLGPGAAHLDDGALRRRLAQRVARDFARRRTERVEGWILARSEVRVLAALHGARAVRGRPSRAASTRSRPDALAAPIWKSQRRE